ncbi:hypothetical protein I7I53_11636 [Histoplasma capsulatum var. duboisii H88]|uniref:Uncharacterized protein n=1 Tax=Ajellomyces capsulatus (strain H88) TaxID=544711 RepID=A0A8A1LY27_AJEC8|nr:hypothetical protein I7I53_11636 [Histoplasma capsulatum var. duboisii H88]
MVIIYCLALYTYIYISVHSGGLKKMYEKANGRQDACDCVRTWVWMRVGLMALERFQRICSRPEH